VLSKSGPTRKVTLTRRIPVRAWLVVVLAVNCAWAQFSPGRLSKAHSSLDSPAKCSSCHALQAVNGGLRCLNCHAEIRQRLNSHRGLHATQVKGSKGQRECAGCHSEHNGEHFVPIRWDVDLADFDHGKTGYTLEGSHRGLECRKCHLPKNIPAAERRKIVVKDLQRTYLGLARECASCHRDEHHGQLSQDCLGCHTYEKWKPASRFEHGKAKYQLTAAHQKVACEKCHAHIPGRDKPYIKFAGLTFSTCESCHKDPHRAAFRAACQSCHSPDAWKPAHPASQFQHSQTEFPLLGKHTQVACNKCHLTSNFKEPVLHARCADCHKKDVHRGQLASRADGGECSACHSVDGWKPSRFNLALHQSTRYPLEGRHATVPCAKCHVPAGDATIYRLKSGQCADCHADRHEAQFAAQPHGNRCEECHTVKGFRPSTYPLARHAESRFPLSGAHLAIACAECHNGPARSQKPAGTFRFADTSCTTCHEDPHRGQFRFRLAAGQGAAAGCESCHTFETWRDLTKFDHAATSFPLTASHRVTPCAKCHKPSDASAGIRSVTFKTAPTLCAGCHEDSHAGQFSVGSASADCGRCHGPMRWKPAAFDHNRTTGFALDGAHVGVNCRACHKTGREINGRYVVLFKSAPKECTGCHGPKANG
jgi:predicted CXXCH cytochrome family protein